MSQVELADLEVAVHVEPDGELAVMPLGHWMWRSPESHARDPIRKASDMFSFGIVVSGRHQEHPYKHYC